MAVASRRDMTERLWEEVRGACRRDVLKRKSRAENFFLLMDVIGDWTDRGLPLRLAWVKAHVGVSRNERADEIAKVGCLTFGDQQVTEGGVRALWKRLRAAQQRVVGLGAGRATMWGR